MFKKILLVASCVAVLGGVSAMGMDDASVTPERSRSVSLEKRSHEEDVPRPVSSPATLERNRPILITNAHKYKDHEQILRFLGQQMIDRHLDISLKNSPRIVLEEAQSSLEGNDFYTASCLFEFLDDSELITRFVLLSPQDISTNQIEEACSKNKGILQMNMQEKYRAIYEVVSEHMF